MFKIASLLLFILPFSSFASEVGFPVGEYKYAKSEILDTKHIKIFNKRTKQGKKLLRTLKEINYNCPPTPSHLIKCSKIVTANPNQVEINTDRLQNLSPIFTSEKAVEKVAEGSTVDTYEVSQKTDVNGFLSEGYTAYHIFDTGLFMDLKTHKDKSLRFFYVDAQSLSYQSYQRERLAKGETFLHRVKSFYSNQINN